MKPKGLYISLWMLFLSLLAGGQTECSIRLRGTVMDVHDSTPLAYATVFVQETGRGETTDESGAFELSGLCPGEQHIVVSHISCESKTFFIRLKQDTLCHFVLDHHATLLDVVEIQELSPGTKAGILSSTLNRDKIMEYSGLTFSELAGRISGVRTLKTGPGIGKPVLQGLSGTRILVLQNGIPLESQQWGNDHAPEVDADIGDKITVLQGTAAVRYGGSAMGGTIAIDPTPSDADPHWHGSVKIIGQSNGRRAGIHTLLKRKIQSVNFRITAGGSGGGDLHTPGYFLTNTGHRQGAASVMLSGNPSGKNAWNTLYSVFYNQQGLLPGAHTGSLTDLAEAMKRNIPFQTKDTFAYRIGSPRQEVTHHLVSADRTLPLTSHSYLRLRGGIQVNHRQEFDIRRASLGARPSLDMVLWSQFYEALYTIGWPERRMSVQWGGQYMYVNNTNQPGTGVSPLVPDYLQNQGALFSLLQCTIGSWRIEGGARADIRAYKAFLINDRQSITVRNHLFSMLAFNAGARRDIAPGITFFSDISLTRRPPDMSELYSRGLHQGVSGIEEGNPDLMPEQSLRIHNEWQIKTGANHMLHTTFFYQYANDFIYLKPDSVFRLTVRGAFPVFAYSSADVSMAGVGLRSAWSLGNQWVLHTQADYIHATNHTIDRGLVRVPPLQASCILQYQRNDISWCHEIKWTMEVTYTAHQWNVDDRDDFLAPPPDYWLAHCLLRCKWHLPSGRDINLMVRGDNLLDIRYRDYMNRLRYFADEPGRNLSLAVQVSL